MWAGVWAHGADQLGSVTHHMTGQPPIMNVCQLYHTAVNLFHTALYMDKISPFSGGRSNAKVSKLPWLGTGENLAKSVH